MPDTPTQTTRRLKYGINVAVAVVVAAALVVVVNLLASKFAPMRDMTALGRYSLSPQTRAVIAGLETDYTLATVMTADFDNPDEDRVAAIRQTKDLVDIYARRSSRLTAEHLTLGQDAAGLQRFYGDLEARYATQLQPIKEAVTRGREALTNLAADAPAQIDLLRALLEEDALPVGQQREFVTLVAQALGRFAQEHARIDDTIGDAVNQPMADYASALATVRAALGEMKSKVYGQAVAQFDRFAKQTDLPPAVRDRLLQARDLMSRSVEALSDAQKAVDNAPDAAEYEELRRQVRDSVDNLIIVGPAKVQVISLRDLAPDATQVVGPRKPELRFLGEERITGSLIAMGMTQPPLVVFVTVGQQPAVGPNGAYEHVARRLRNVNFEVQQWNPAGQMMSTGFMMPAGDPPTPKEGQKAVWVVLPMIDQNPMNPVAGQAAPQVVDLLNRRAAAGDGVMIITSVNPATQFGGEDPIRDWLAPWGITPQTDRIILRELTAADGRRFPTTQFPLREWPTELPVTQALSGLGGIVMQACPLLLGDAGGASGEGDAAASRGVTRYPLVTLDAPRMWAEDDLRMQQAPTFKEAASKGSFVVGVAASNDTSRLIVVADPVWASDDVTTLSTLRIPGEDAVEIYGAMFPANAELFVNGVYWLSGLEELIAASPRSQDIRRISAIEPEKLKAIRLSTATILPLLALAAGVAVWAVRRRA